MSNTAERLIKESEEILERGVYLPVVLQKCAERGHVPETEEEMASLMAVAGEIREKVASGELAPVPLRALEQNGQLSKQASAALEEDPFALSENLNVDLDEVEPVVKEAAAVATWATLEAVQD